MAGQFNDSVASQGTRFSCSTSCLSFGANRHLPSVISRLQSKCQYALNLIIDLVRLRVLTYLQLYFYYRYLLTLQVSNQTGIKLQNELLEIGFSFKKIGVDFLVLYVSLRVHNLYKSNCQKTFTDTRQIVYKLETKTTIPLPQLLATLVSLIDQLISVEKIRRKRRIESQLLLLRSDRLDMASSVK